MTISSSAALFGAMLALAIIPDASVLAVVARSLASGFFHGLVTVIGIVVGDFVFILSAVFGLSLIAEAMGSLFVLVKYFGGAYLVWLGVALWRSRSDSADVKGIREPSWWSNFLCGLSMTLGDPKAVLFYMSFLPAFVELSSISFIDTLIIMALATTAVAVTKLGYALMADKAKALFKSSGARKTINMGAGSVMIGTGLFLVARA